MDAFGTPPMDSDMLSGVFVKCLELIRVRTSPAAVENHKKCAFPATDSIRSVPLRGVS